MRVLLAEPMLALDEVNSILSEPINQTEPQIFIDRPEVAPRDVTATMIVCGNCSGDQKLPRKTLLTRDGCCDCCGGHSFILAAEIEIARRVACALKQQPEADKEGDHEYAPTTTEPRTIINRCFTGEGVRHS